ncbi:hypothetical protein NRY68_16525 [Acidithiobacillus ferrooxidans]|uniref:hypothetical protein n=1 Tax=Acidithiobacillus ferrooxidans TaxID=920 RepID=UPI0021490D80|nr:hypothetical protein [Acidithiobacillus ferrooxidans]MCR1347356.1 hypothetical protein [Acidithiobacillus ferrooxidans]MCR1354783.1 hypothetical protein [Acidithiobacillus ferrooxidans]
MSIPYIIGRRTTVKTPVTGQPGCRMQGCRQHGRDTSNLRAEDSGTTALRTLGWSVATFGAGAVLGWVATRKSSARGPEDDAS